MMVTFSGALLIAPAKRMAGGMGKQQFVMMELDTVPIPVFLLGQGRWVANTALKTLLLTTAAGDLSCVAPRSESVKKVAHGVGQSLPAKIPSCMTALKKWPKHSYPP